MEGRGVDRVDRPFNGGAQDCELPKLAKISKPFVEGLGETRVAQGVYEALCAFVRTKKVAGKFWGANLRALESWWRSVRAVTSFRFARSEASETAEVQIVRGVYVCSVCV